MHHVLLLIFWCNALFSFLPGFPLPLPVFFLPCNNSHSFIRTHSKQTTNQELILPYFPPCSQNHMQRFGGVLSWGRGSFYKNEIILYITFLHLSLLI